MLANTTTQRLSRAGIIISATTLASSLTVFIINKFQLKASWQDLIVKLALAAMAVSAVVLALSGVALYRATAKAAHAGALNDQSKSPTETVYNDKAQDESTQQIEKIKREKDEVEKERDDLQQKLSEALLPPINRDIESVTASTNTHGKSDISLQYDNSNNIRNQLNNIQKQIEETVEKLDNLEEEQKNSQVNSDERTEEINLLNNQLNGLEERKRTLQWQNNRLFDENDGDVEQKKDDLQEEVERLKQELNKVKEENKTLQEEIAGLKDQLTEKDNVLVQNKSKPKKTQQEHEKEAIERITKWQKKIMTHLDGEKCKIIMNLNTQAFEWEKKNSPPYQGLDELQEKAITFLNNLTDDESQEMDNEKCNIIEWLYNVATLNQASLLQVQHEANQNPTYEQHGGDYPSLPVGSNHDSSGNEQDFSSLPASINSAGSQKGDSDQEEIEGGYSSPADSTEDLSKTPNTENFDAKEATPVLSTNKQL